MTVIWSVVCVCVCQQPTPLHTARSAKPSPTLHLSSHSSSEKVTLTHGMLLKYSYTLAGWFEMLPVSFYEKYKYSAVFWGVFVYLIQNSFFIIGAFWFGNIKKTEDRVENESKKKKKKNITEHLKLSCKPSHEPNDRQAQHPCLGPYCPLVEVKIKIADDFTAVATQRPYFKHLGVI